ncbi:MAG: Ig-like domain-containing protein, partial [Treponemataceae bacterium]|nr:Ig-like domain-containing protein [Treponemataceae bacterium]
KLSRIALLAAASAFMLAVFPACGDDDDGEEPTSTPQPSVKIVTEATSMAVEVDGTLDLMAEVSNFPEGDVTYDWKSDKTDIATVAQNPENKAQAQVKAVAAGTAKITVTATVGETVKTAEVTVTVAAKGSNPEPVTPPPASDAVTAAWDFTTSPAGFPTSDAEADAITDFSIAPKSGNGATLTATGRWKYQSDPASLQAQASSNKTVADAATWTTITGGKWLTLTLEGDATVTIKYAGAGGADPKRFVAVVDANKAVKFASAEAGIGATELTETLTLTKGTYTIAMNGSRIFSINCAGNTN